MGFEHRDNSSASHPESGAAENREERIDKEMRLVRQLVRLTHQDGRERFKAEIPTQTYETLADTWKRLEQIRKFHIEHRRFPNTWQEVDLDAPELCAVLQVGEEESEVIEFDGMATPRSLIKKAAEQLGVAIDAEVVNLDAGAQPHEAGVAASETENPEGFTPEPEVYESELSPEKIESYVDDIITIFKEHKSRVAVDQKFAQMTLDFFRTLAQEIRDSGGQLDVKQIEQKFQNIGLSATEPSFAGITQENKLDVVTIFRGSDSSFPIAQLLKHIEEASVRARQLIENAKNEDVDDGELK